MPENNEETPNAEVIEVDENEGDDQKVNEKSPFKPSPTFLDGDGDQAKEAMRRILGLLVDKEDK